MPLVKIQKSGEGSLWGLWSITETESDLLADGLSVPVEIVHSAKRLEWIAARVLTKEILAAAALPYNGISKNSDGKPLLINHSHAVSLSHSYPYVAAQVSSQTQVGIDIEQPKKKLLKIAGRVLSTTEQTDAGDNITKHCIYWCAKEAMFKIYSTGGLHFAHQLNVAPFELSKEGLLSGIISGKNGKQNVTLAYETHEDFVVVYTKT